jgi:hypothetical protein
MPQFRKKPVVIEAIQWNPTDPDSVQAVLDFIPETQRRYMAEFSNRDEIIGIETLEGLMVAKPGDWIIRGVKGEFYLCKPDIFAATYEAV